MCEAVRTALDWVMRSLLLALATALTVAALSPSAQRLSRPSLRLPAAVQPDHYDLWLVVDLAHKRFEGTETIRVHTTAPTSRIVLHALDLTLQEVTVGSDAAAQRASVSIDKM